MLIINNIHGGCRQGELWESPLPFPFNKAFGIQEIYDFHCIEIKELPAGINKKFTEFFSHSNLASKMPQYLFLPTPPYHN